MVVPLTEFTLCNFGTSTAATCRIMDGEAFQIRLVDTYCRGIARIGYKVIWGLSIVEVIEIGSSTWRINQKYYYHYYYCYLLTFISIL
jgi:hypothetical protein